MDTKVFRDISYGMYIVTTKKDKNVGCMINTLIQITSENPTIAISLNKENYTNQCIAQEKRFAVSILEEKKDETQEKIISTFGYFSSKDKDKFSQVKYEEVDGLPVVVENMCSYLICDVINVVDCGTHNLWIGKVTKAKKIEQKTPMTYRYYHEVLKGKSPKKAPTYVEEETKETTKGNQYRCKICGYIYDDAKEKVKFEDLPEDWKCPRCGVGKDYFEKI